jgi:biopolymer transport protein ExbD
MIRWRCSGCGKRLQVSDHRAGQTGTCPKCFAPFTVPPAGTNDVAKKAQAPAKAVRRERAVPATDYSGPKHAPLPTRASTLDGEHHDLIDMTAMVDVVFFLLIFFMVTSLNSQQASIELPLPSSQRAGGPQAHQTIADYEDDDAFVVVRIDADNSIWVGESEVLSAQELISELRAARDDQVGATPKMLVVGHGDAHHGTVVTVLDAGRDVGIADIRLALSEEG